MNTIQLKEDRLSGMVKSFSKHFISKSRMDFRQLFFGFIILCLTVLLPAITFAQGNSDAPIEMADTMRANGKIYVVVLVIGILFTGLFVFAIRTDSKVSKLEKEVKNMKILEES